MQLEGADPSLLVAKQHDLLAQQFHLLRQVTNLVRGAGGLPISAQQLTHRAARLNTGQLVVRRRCLSSIRRFHHLPPVLPIKNASSGRLPLSTTVTAQLESE